MATNSCFGIRSVHCLARMHRSSRVHRYPWRRSSRSIFAVPMRLRTIRFANAKAVAIHDRLVKEINSGRNEQQKIEGELSEVSGEDDELRQRWTEEWGAAWLSPPFACGDERVDAIAASHLGSGRTVPRKRERSPRVAGTCFHGCCSYQRASGGGGIAGCGARTSHSQW